jgi:hypothetical protein
MSQLPVGFEVRGVYFYRDPTDSHRFFYIPGEPASALSPDGQSTLSLMISDQMALLQLESCWGLTAPQQGAIEQDLQRQFPDLSAALIRLSPAPVVVQSIILQLGDGTGQFYPLQTSAASGFPPFTALFHVQLTNDQKAAAIAALNGNKDYLVVIYKATLTIDILVTTTIQGDVRTDLAKLKQTATLADCVRQIEIAIAEKRLMIQRQYPELIEPALVEKVDQMAKEKAASLLLHNLKSPPFPDRSTLKVTATLSTPQELNLERSTDISTWFQDGTGLDHLRVLPPVDPEPVLPESIQSVEVRLKFEAKDSVIAFIQVEAGTEKATLRPPQFDPVKLANLQPDNHFTVTTHYTDGGSDWQTQLPLPKTSEWNMTPQNVGLAQVLVDAGDRKQAGSTALQIHVRYNPTGKGTADERTLYFRFGDWIESWYLVTRSADLAGVLEVSAVETTADDRVIQHPLITTTETEIKL